MIRILDNMVLTLLRDTGKFVLEEHSCYVPEEIQSEFLNDSTSDAWYRRCKFSAEKVEQADYLEAFSSVINQYKGVSFYALKGMGDVAILSTAMVLIKRSATQTATLFPDLESSDGIIIVSGDQDLRDFVQKNFSSKVKLETPEEFASSI